RLLKHGLASVQAGCTGGPPGRAPSPAPPVLPRSATAPRGRNPGHVQGLGGFGPGGVNLRPSGPRPLPGSAGTPPLRYRSTGKKSWTCARTGWRRSRRGDPAALRAAPPPRLRRYSPAPRRRRSGASSALVEPAGDLEERLDEVLAMPGRDDMGHLVGDRPRVGRTADQ